MEKESSIEIKLHKSATPLQLNMLLKQGTKKYLLTFFFMLLCSCISSIAQPVKTFYVKDTKAENRAKLYKNLVGNINKNLSLPLADSTEENWMDAFYSVELLRYRSPWAEGRIHAAFAGINTRTVYFQRSLMEMLYDSYPVVFEKQVKQLLDSTSDSKLFAMCAEYLLRPGEQYKKDIAFKTWQLYHPDITDPVLNMLLARMNILHAGKKLPPLKDLLQYSFFSNAKIVFSFQRKNRNYPGIAIVRDSAGGFLKDQYGNIFSVPQLARSINNLPGYISNGNTPQGIFRMYGFDVSKSTFIGPTQNIQLTMPFETSIRHFMNDSNIIDSVWTEDWYRKLLPESWKDYFPLLETYYASKAGRTEIIAHGTTVDPTYYKGQPYYPFTPTLGCLCTKELWSADDGNRTMSDQQKLVEALQRAGGADGYYIVIELNDDQRAVDINDILPLLK